MISSPENDAIHTTPAITVHGLVNRFGAQWIHDDLDLEVIRGEILGVIGGSGTGKSVLLRTIVGLNRPQQGDIRILGERLSALRGSARKAVLAR
ncbi:MAG: ATP-binding cassette domain-containing protein, partial [Rhodospirillaceae bacterium]|nr:ATP-binding cassette domain-containing protein [Rhodospirillaceae bacterium]